MPAATEAVARLVWMFSLPGLLAPAAMAASLQITPIRIDLPAGPGAAALTLRNPGEHAIHAQVRVFRWTQADGEDVLTPTEDVVASPPILRIDPRGEQLVRIVRQGPDAVSAETTYRLLIDELPQDATAPSSGVRLQLRYSVPVFVGSPDAAGPPRVTFSLWRDADGWRLGASNLDNRHAQVVDVALAVGTGSPPAMLATGLLGYVLPGSRRSWRVPLPAGTDVDARARLRVTINGNAVERPLAAEPLREGP